MYMRGRSSDLITVLALSDEFPTLVVASASCIGCLKSVCSGVLPSREGRGACLPDIGIGRQRAVPGHDGAPQSLDEDVRRPGSAAIRVDLVLAGGQFRYSTARGAPPRSIVKTQACQISLVSGRILLQIALANLAFKRCDGGLFFRNDGGLGLCVSQPPPTIELGQPKLDESGKDRMAALCIETADDPGPDLPAEQQLDQRRWVRVETP